MCSFGLMCIQSNRKKERDRQIDRQTGRTMAKAPKREREREEIQAAVLETRNFTLH